MLRWLSLISILLIGITLFFSYLGLEYVRGQRLNVVVLTVESLRRDLVNVENTPNLLSAVESGGRLTNHLAVSGWTGANIVSILSGLSPFTSGVHTRGQSVDPAYVLPLEQLVRKGYSAEGIQGFMTMDIYSDLGLSVIDPGADLLYWLAGKQVEGRPFFLWYHYLYTHLPYPALTTPKEANGENLTDGQAVERYQAASSRSAIHVGEYLFKPEDVSVIGSMHAMAVREFDLWFEQFWEFYLASGMHRNTILIVTADHGDEHGERGLVGHASTTLAGHLHAEIVNLPFLYWLPESLKKRKWLNEPHYTSHMDIMPTILDALGMESVEDLPGHSLFAGQADGLWTGMTSGGGFSEKDPRNVEYYMYGVQQKEWKLLWKRYSSGSEEFYLYNTLKDEGEKDNLASAHPGKVRVLKDLLEPLISAQTVRPVHASAVANQEGEKRVKLSWIFPQEDSMFRYEELDGKFRLEWNGVPGQNYIIHYEAGTGGQKLSGDLEVRGPVKDFGIIGKRYWDTWIVPYSPYRIRVATAGEDNWSDWITLEAAR